MLCKGILKSDWLLVLKLTFVHFLRVSKLRFMYTDLVYDSAYWPNYMTRVHPRTFDESSILRVLCHILRMLTTDEFVRLMSFLSRELGTRRFIKRAIAKLKLVRVTVKGVGLRRMTRNCRVRNLLGKNVLYVPRFTMHGMGERQKTNWFDTSRVNFDLLMKLLKRSDVNVNVSGVISDPCCGIDESMVYVFNRYFGRAVTKVVLSDFYHGVGLSADLRKADDSARLLSDVDWVVTSPPYIKGNSMSDIMLNILKNVRVGAALKLPNSAQASRSRRADWWGDFVPNYCLVCDPVRYRGFTSPTVNPEVWMVWLKGVPSVGTLQFNQANLDIF